MRHDLFFHLLVNHHRHVGHHRLAFRIKLRNIHHHRHAVGQNSLTLRVQLGRLNHHCDVGHDGLAFFV